MTYIKIQGTEYPAKVQFRAADIYAGGARTATVTLVGSVDEVKHLLSDTERWDFLQKDISGQIIKSKDCSDYDQLLSVQDNLDGSCSAKLKKTSAEEILKILMGGG